MQKKVIIIGAGIIGLSIAYNLAKNGISVTIIEKGIAGRESSWAAAGMLRPQAEFENENLLRLCLESLRMYQEFSNELKAYTGIDINYRLDGTIIAAIDNEQLKELTERYESQKRLGLQVDWLSKEELLKLEPNASAGIKSAVLIKGDHWADNRLIINALIKAIKKFKGEIIENCAVNSYIHNKNRVIGVETQKGKFLWDFVINSAGSWASQIKSEDKKLIPAIKPIRGQLIEIETPDWLIRHNVCTYGSYLASKNKNHVLIGSTMEDAGFEKKVTEEGIAQLMKNAIALVPKIRECKIIDKWTGFRPTSPDKLPVLGKTSSEGLLIATGTYRNGILLAPVIGKSISETIITGEEPEIIKPFNIDRFN